jgi:hypothetical protein
MRHQAVCDLYAPSEFCICLEQHPLNLPIIYLRHSGYTVLLNLPNHVKSRLAALAGLERIFTSAPAFNNTLTLPICPTLDAIIRALVS